MIVVMMMSGGGGLMKTIPGKIKRDMVDCVNVDEDGGDENLSYRNGKGGDKHDSDDGCGGDKNKS